MDSYFPAIILLPLGVQYTLHSCTQVQLACSVYLLPYREQWLYFVFARKNPSNGVQLLSVSGMYIDCLIVVSGSSPRISALQSGYTNLRIVVVSLTW